MYVCVSVCMYIHTNTYIHIHIYIYTYIYIYLHMYICTYMYIYIYIYVCVCVFACVCMYVCIQMHIWMHKYLVVPFSEDFQPLSRLRQSSGNWRRSMTLIFRAVRITSASTCHDLLTLVVLAGMLVSIYRGCRYEHVRIHMYIYIYTRYECKPKISMCVYMYIYIYAYMSNQYTLVYVCACLPWLRLG